MALPCRLDATATTFFRLRSFSILRSSELESERERYRQTSILAARLSRTLAASYVGVSPTTFDRMIKDGLMPRPKAIYGRRGGEPPQGKRGVMKMQVAFTTTAVATSIALIAVVSAQEPKAVKTVKVTQSLNDTALYEVKDDGTVLIDWDEVEALAASKQAPVLLPQAQVMLAIRDGKWKATDHAHN